MLWLHRSSAVMSRFRITVSPAVLLRDIHLRLYVRREEQWALCGMFHLERNEWDELSAFLTRAGIEVLSNESSV